MDRPESLAKPRASACNRIAPHFGRISRAVLFAAFCYAKAAFIVLDVWLTLGVLGMVFVLALSVYMFEEEVHDIASWLWRFKRGG